jgi:predicted ATP-dependent serine protease
MDYEKLKIENQKLVSKCANTENKVKQAEYKREIHLNKVKMYDLILESDKSRAGENGLTFRDRVRKKHKKPKFSTGISDIDFKLGGGFESGMYIQIAGESGVGKSDLTLEIGTNMSLSRKIVIFNFEMGENLLEMRLSNKNLSDKQWKNLWIDQESRLLNSLIMEIELLIKEGYEFFIIDSKMKIIVEGNAPTHEKISHLSNELARLCANRDINIMLINQMNEEDIKNKRLAMKGSGDQKYDADIALFYVKDDAGKRTLICTKNRQGDERLFKLELFKDNQGKTVGKGSHIETTYEMPKILD